MKFPQENPTSGVLSLQTVIRDILAWETAAFHPDFTAGETGPGEETHLIPSVLCHSFLLPMTPHHGALPLGAYSSQILFLISSLCCLPPRFSAEHSWGLGYLKILLIREVSATAPASTSSPMFGFCILCFLIPFLGLNYDYTALLCRIDFK